MKIGVAGLGRMGAAIARRLLEVGHHVVVWNRTAHKTRPLADAGAEVAATPAELVRRADAVITILTDARAIDAVYRGETGLLSAAPKGVLFVEMSTVEPDTEIALAKAVAAAGASFVECPVGGTVGPALQGRLLGLAGGERADVERARPLLEQLCRRVEHVGPVGAGASMKLAINLPLAVFWQAFGEAYALCRHLGADTQWLVELFADTSGGPNVLKARGAAVGKALAGQDPGSATFDCASILKDLRLMIAQGKERGFALPLAQQTLAVYEQASAEGWGARDCVELPAFWSSRHRD